MRHCIEGDFLVLVPEGLPGFSADARQAVAKAIAAQLEEEAVNRWGDDFWVTFAVATAQERPNDVYSFDDDEAEALAVLEGTASVDEDEVESAPGHTPEPEILAELVKLEARIRWEEIEHAYAQGKADELVPLRCGKCGNRLFVEGKDLAGYHVVDPWEWHDKPEGADAWGGEALDCPFCRADRGGSYPLELEGWPLAPAETTEAPK